jgi:hypothetical protein
LTPDPDINMSFKAQISRVEEQTAGEGNGQGPGHHCSKKALRESVGAGEG